MYKFILFLALISSALTSYGQTGKIRGTVYEQSTGEPLIGVTVVIKGTTKGAVTDFDGKFEISASPGTYDVQISFVSFETVTISGVEVKVDEITVLDNIMLKEAVEELQEVVITADVIRDSEAALITVKRKSANLMDGISAAKFRKIGDSDAADAVKRVPGVSIEGGKYVYVRGLGDRYTKTTLNNVDIPGLDPDRNSLQIDIFPTNLIDNMLVLKSSVAEMPADFTGGVVNIETKDFPEERIFNISASVGFNPSMHFNKDYITYDGSNTDFLGFDNGQRNLPQDARGEMIPRPGIGDYSDAEINTFLKRFNPVLGAKKQTSFMDYSLGVSLGDQFSLKGDNKLGYIFSLTYKNSTKFYDDQFYGEYQRATASDQYELVPAVEQNGVLSENNILLGGLAGLAFKTLKSKYKLTFMHLQNGEKKAGQFYIFDNSEATGKSGYTGTSDNLDYSERGLTNVLLSGEHYNSDGKWEIDWKLSPTFSSIADPDIRKTTFTFSQNGTDTLFSAGAGGNPTRSWRYLNEVNLVGKIDLTREYEALGEPAKLKFGVSHIYKQRDYEILTYDLQFFGKQPEFGYDPNNVLTDENLWPNGKLYYNTSYAEYAGQNINAYNSNVNNSGIYLSNEFSPFKKLKTILGLRAENYQQRYTGVGRADSLIVLDNDVVLDAFDLFPSANIIFAINDAQNLRFSYSRTIARPSFKEMSYAQILDPISNRQFNGGLFVYKGDWNGDLHETRINNLDLRWEYFMNRGQLFSLSAFYKTFDGPIELVRIPSQQTITELQPRNVGDGQVYGAELELRKSLDFISPALTNVSFSSNVTFVKSIIKMTDLEYNARKGGEKDGQNIDNKRDMAGQAPYIINAGFAYENREAGFDAGLFYNVQGKTLLIVGTGLYPDVYSEPFQSLNFNMNKSFGANKRSSINFNASNILNDTKEQYYSSFEAQDQLYERYSPGISFSLGVKYEF